MVKPTMTPREQVIAAAMCGEPFDSQAFMLAMVDEETPLVQLSAILVDKIAKCEASLARLRGSVGCSLETDYPPYRDHMSKTLAGWTPHLLSVVPEIVAILMIFARRLKGNADARETIAGGRADGSAASTGASPNGG